VNDEIRFYQEPAFIWISLFVFPPLGIILLWACRLYDFMMRLIISVFFLALFRINALTSVAIVLIVILLLLEWARPFLTRVSQEEVNEESFDNLETYDETDLKGAVESLFIKGGYQIEKIDEQKAITVVATKAWKRCGIYIHQSEEPLVKDQVEQFHRALVAYQLNRGIIIVTTDYSVYAEETASKLDIQLWNKELLIDKLSQQLIRLEYIERNN